MRDERDIPDTAPRPLPSIDLPLLPHQRRAARARQLAIGAAAVLALGLVAAAGAYSSARSPVDSATKTGAVTTSVDAEVAPVVASAYPLPADDPGATDATRQGQEGALEPLALGTPSRITRPFGQAPGFRDALLRAGCPRDDAVALVNALDRLVDFTRCRPEHQLVFERDAEGQLNGFEYVVSNIERYRADRGENGRWKAQKISVDIQLRRLRKGSHISGSLGAALEAQGLGRSLAGVFVEVFEGRIDFYRDTRAGDSFRIIVDEQYADGQSLGYGTIHALEYVGQRAGRLTAFWFEPEKGRGDFFDADGRAMHGGWLRTPLRYDHISSPFNLRRRHPILKRIIPHNGIDYAAATGTTVWAAADGVITVAGNKGPNGNLVVIRHDGGYETAYAHLSRIARGINPGVKVRQRQTIGAVGSTGRSTGPHLHFGLKRNGTFIDPLSQLNGPGRPLPRPALPRYKQTVQKLQAELNKVPLAPAPAEEVVPPPALVQDFHD